MNLIKMMGQFLDFFVLNRSTNENPKTMKKMIPNRNLIGFQIAKNQNLGQPFFRDPMSI